MLGLIHELDQVSWTDEHYVVHYGVVVALTDDAVWADVRELDSEDTFQLPTSILNVLD